MKVLRSSLIVAAAVFTAACGDKVTVPGTVTTTIPLIVHSVTVAPSTATLPNLGTVTLTPAVTADPGAVVTPIVWTSSNTAIAAVSSAGVVTAAAAPAAGSVGVCASVGGATGCATILVQAGQTVTPATVSIASVTVSCSGLPAGSNCGLNDPVNPLAVAGQVDVRVNVSAGSGSLSGYTLQVLVGTVVVGTQTFTATASAALVAASSAAIEAQITPPQVVFSVNTAAFNPTTGVPTFVNGVYTLSAKLIPPSGSATTATSQQTLTFANVNTFALTTSITGGSGAPAISAAGYSYRNGSIVATVLPVIFTPGITMAAGNITFGTAGCDAVGPRTIPLVPTTVGPPAIGPWTATFTTAKGAGSGADFKSYEFRTLTPACAAVIATGEGFTVTGTDNAGNGFLAGTGPAIAAGTLYRMDNVAPPAPSIVTNPNGRQNGWTNPGAPLNALLLTGLNAVATPNGWMVNNVAGDLGVGGYVRKLRIGVPGAGAIADPVSALASSATPANPAPTVANTSLCAVPSAADLLGNESAAPAAGTVCILPLLPSVTQAAGAPVLLGVDIAPPTIAFSGGMAAGSAGKNGRTGASVGAEFTVAVTDTGIVGNSGMLATTPVNATVVIRSAAAGLTALQLCPVGTVTAGVCTASATGMALPAFPLVSTAITGQTIIGYYTFTGSSIDAAGNPSTAAVSRTVAYNPVATNLPTLSAATPGSIPISGSSVTFNALGASGNTTVNGPTTFFDVWKVTYSLTYTAAAFPGPLVYPSTTLNGFNGTMLNNNVPVGITINGFVRQAEAQTSACNVAVTTGGPIKPATLNENLFDQVNNASGPVPSAINPAQVPSGVVYTGAVGPLQTFSFIESNGISEAPVTGCPFAVGANTAVKVSTGGASTSADPTTVTLNADVFGPTATYNPLFTRVDFYVFVGGNMEQIGSTSAYSTVDDGSTNGRRHRFSFVWTPGATSPVLGAALPLGGGAGSSATCAAADAVNNLHVYAVGVSAVGDALVTPLNTNVCLTTAP